METAYINELYRYNRWANQKTLAAASRLDEKQFTRELGNSFSSVRDTLVHILGAEWIWLERWNRHSPRALPSVAEIPTLAAIRARWKQVEEERTRFLERLGPADLDAPVSYVNLRGETSSYPLWQQLAHVVNHSNYHRGQITTLLRQLRADAVSTDLLLYYDELGQAQERGGR
jgi:uncharacterized damage-inducible protein DinB